MKQASLARAIEINEEIANIDKKISELEKIGDVNTISFRGTSRTKESTGAIQTHSVSKPTEGDISIHKDSKYATLAENLVNSVIIELKEDKKLLEKAFEELP